MNKALFLSLAPRIIDEKGHGIVYQKCLEFAAKQLHLSYFALFPQQSNIRSFQKNWIRFFRSNKLFLFFDFCRLFLIKRRKIVFIESFNTSDLIYLVLSTLFLAKKEDRICVLFRYPFNQMRWNGILHVLLLRLCKKRIILFTDSELIAQESEKRLKRPLFILPIPHGESKNGGENEKTICWWPGEPREAKGLSDLLRIAQLPRENVGPVELVAAKKSQLPNATLIPDILSREEYLFWLHQAKFILLPYDPIVYRSGTSGIFVEAILAGKIPLVKEGSWLAHELKKHDLPELILDWNHPAIFSEIEKLGHNSLVQEKLKKMREVYSEWHSQAVFTEKLRFAIHPT